MYSHLQHVMASATLTGAVPPGYTTDKDGSIVPGSVYDGDACPIPPDAEEIARLSTALNKVRKPTQGTESRVYGGDPNLIHAKDGTRADVGSELATALDMMMRAAALEDGARTAEQIETQDLCPGCYMVALYDAAVWLAQRNGQSLSELGRTMAKAFNLLAMMPDNGNPFTEEIEVILDPEPEVSPDTSGYAAPNFGYAIPFFPMEAI